MALAQLARLRLRVGSGTVNVAWGEAALIVGLYLVPAGWLPAAVFLGVSVAVFLISAVSERRTLSEIAHIAASLTVATALAAAVGSALGNPYGATLTPRLALALAAASLAYLAVTTVLVALTVALRHGLSFPTLLLRTLHIKLIMFVGNVVVGLVIVTFLERDPRWLVLLPPALWLLQQTYAHRLRADEEHRAWQALAKATQAFNQLDERGVAVAGVRGASGPFRRGPGGDRRAPPRRRLPSLHRHGPAGTAVVVEADGTAARVRPTTPPAWWSRERSPSATPPSANCASDRPTSAALSGREQHALSAFGDALAAALHDAATHRELRILEARSSYDAVHDPLTNLINRSALLAKGDVKLRLMRNDEPVACSLLDIDNFREVNDTLGHAAGDELLKVMAARLRELRRARRAAGAAGRRRVRGADRRQHRRRRALRGRPAGADAGGAAPGSADRPAARRADRGRRAAAVGRGVGRRRGRSRRQRRHGRAAAPRRASRCTRPKTAAATSPGTTAPATAASTDQLALLAELREALAADDQLVLALQPAVDLTTGAPTGVEALVRWRHPRRGSWQPGEFIRDDRGQRAAGHIYPVRDRQGAGAAAEWARQGVTVPISVNVSARSLLDPRLPADVAELLRRHRVPAAPARPGDHRDGGDERAGGRSTRCSPACAPAACGSPSTTSAPASRR